MDSRIEKILFTNKTIEKEIGRAAAWVDKNYQDKKPIIVGILKGSIPFCAALIKKIETDIILDFMAYSSYRNSTSPETKPILKFDLRQNIEGKDVIIVEDIVDTGNTLSAIVKLLSKRNPKSIKVITLVDKPTCRQIKFEPDYVCLTSGDEFLVGYGLDYAELFRNKPYIGILKKEVYTK